jgi:hypothetical protein
MTRCTWKMYGLFGAVLLLAGCPRRSAHRPEPSAPVQAGPAAPEPKPPAPKCEKIEDGCVASEGVKVGVKDSGFTFAPPVGWAFAKEEALSVASTTTAAMAVTAHDLGAAKKEPQSRLAALDLLAAKMGVALPKKKLVWPKKAHDVLETGGMKISLWQVEKLTRNKAKGVLLVFWATPSGGQGITGAGFVSNDDATKADDAILGAVKSIGRAP